MFTFLKKKHKQKDIHRQINIYKKKIRDKLKILFHVKTKKNKNSTIHLKM